MDNKLLMHAIEYWEKGISIFPLAPNSKSPLSEALPIYNNETESKRSWKQFQNERATKEQIIEWWTKYPNANIAGVMGRISGVICVDQDLRKDDNHLPLLDENGDPIERGDISGFPPTLSATSWSRGKHLFYGYREGIPTRAGFRYLVDIRSDGSYIVLAPSIVNGRTYEWDMDWKSEWGGREPFPINILPKPSISEERLDIKKLINIKQGGRNDSMHKIACSLLAKGHSDEDVVYLIKEINRTYIPPLDLSELEILFRSARDFISNSRRKEKDIKQQDFNFVPWGEFSTKEFPEISWRIRNLIPMGGFVILSAISGEKKTWLSLEMARCISQGINFLNSELFQTQPGRVLYVDQENPERDIVRRGKQLGITTKENLLLWRPDSLNMNDETTAKQFIDQIIDANIDIVFIDTLRATAGGLKEDRAEDVRMFFNRFKILKDKNVVIVFLDHLRKPQHFEGRTPKKEQLLGSQDKTASVEVLLQLSSTRGSDEIQVYQSKNRLDREIEPFKIRMQDSVSETGARSTTLIYGGVIEESEPKKEVAKGFICELLKEGNKTTTEILNGLSSRKIGQKNIKLALRELEAEGNINVSKQGRMNLYRLGENGEEATPES